MTGFPGAHGGSEKGIHFVTFIFHTSFPVFNQLELQCSSPMGSLMRMGSVSSLGFPGPARFSAKTLKRYFFLVGSPFTLSPNKDSDHSSIQYFLFYSSRIFLPEGGFCDGQLVASDPLVCLWVKFLDPVTSDGTAAVLVGLKPGQGNCILGNIRGCDSGRRTRRI